MEQGKSVRGVRGSSPEGEGVAEAMCDDLTTATRWKRKLGVKLSQGKKNGGRYFKIYFIFLIIQRWFDW